MDVKSFNLVTLVGILGGAPDVSSPQPNVKIANFNVGTIRGWINEIDKFQSETIWHRVMAWNAAAVIVEGLKKGDYVIIKGALGYQTINGNKREAVIHTENVIPLGKMEEIPDPLIN